MKRMLSTTALISLVLTSAQPWPVLAQEAPACVPGADGACVTPEQQAAEEAARLEAEAAKAAAEEAARLEAEAAKAAAEEAARLEAEAAKAAAEEAARLEAEAAKAAAEEAARLEAEAAKAAAEEAARLEAEAAARAAAEQAAQAEAEAKAAAEAAAAEAAKVQPVPDQPAPEQPTAEQPTAEQPAPEQPAPEQPAAEQPAVEQPAPEQPAGDAPAAEVPLAPVPAPSDPAQPAAEQPAPEQPAADQPAAEQPVEQPAEQPADLSAEEQEVLKAAEEAARLAAEQAAAAAAAPPPAPVDAPVVAPEVSQNLDALIAGGGAEAPPAAAAASPDAGAAAPGAAPESAPGSSAAPAVAPAVISETVITPADTRSSAQEFAPPPQQLAGSKKSGLSDLERAGLFALGALVLGKVMTGGQEVVANSGDRVVVRDPEGGYQLYKDDDSLLRRPGSTLRNESFADGSSRTVVDREDGSRVVTLRDASGRVLQRTQIDRNGREYVLIDDLRRFERVDVRTLPKAPPQNFVVSNDRGDPALAAALARQNAVRLDRSYSLQQIRDTAQLRHLAAAVDVDQVTFATGSSVIRPSEAPKLASLGRLMQQMLAENPREIFLIEGHTDAVGSAASNLTLSDRRAESLALALTEYYRVPPENMVVQGYGEAELRVATQSAEPANRRAAVRLITPLMYGQR